MTGKVLSLSRVRKARVKTAKRAQADENATKFGLPKPLKTLDKANNDLHATRLDSHKREI